MANIVPRHNQPGPIARQFSEWDPFERMRDLMQFDLFQDLPRRWLMDQAPSASYMPRFDVREEKECFTIKADMPGIKEADVDISITGNRLTISGKREEEKVDESKSYYTRERSYGSFSRAFTLPETIDADQIRAAMQDGVLEMTIPKRAESQPKKIALQTRGGGSASSGSGSNRATSGPGGNGEQPAQRTPKGESL
jgi:HSP20 family protein